MVLIKRITAVVTAFTLAMVMQGASLTAFSEGDVSEADSITKAAIVTEVSTGQVLYEHNSHEKAAYGIGNQADVPADMGGGNGKGYIRYGYCDNGYRKSERYGRLGDMA